MTTLITFDEVEGQPFTTATAEKFPVV